MKMLWPVTASLLLAISGCSKASPDSAATSSADKAAAAFVSTPIQEISGSAPESVRKAITDHLKIAGLPAHITSVIETGMPNLYWVTFREVPPVFISSDGQFLIQGGDLNKLGNGTVTNLSDALTTQEAKRQMLSIPEKELIIFSPKSKPKAVIYAFTDVDCGYCRKMHSEIDQVNAKGIEVRYIAWPRSPDDVANNKAVWCSEDRKAAFTTATAGLPVQAPACDDPVMNHRHIGMLVGVNGTPAVYDANGKYLGGYMPANDLAKILKIDGK